MRDLGSAFSVLEESRLELGQLNSTVDIYETGQEEVNWEHCRLGIINVNQCIITMP